MKHNIVLVAVLSIIYLSTQSLSCGRNNIRNNCNEYIYDTVYLPHTIINISTTYRVGDTIKLYSKINDTINAVSGKSFVYERNFAYSNVQAFKVVTNGNVKELNYANIEFNPIVTIGQFQNNPYNGFNFSYNRTKPYNTLQAAFIAGKVGLYIFNLNENGGVNYVQEKGNFCSNYLNIAQVPIQNQNVQYWDTLGVSTISLANGSGFPNLKKGNKNYFFVKVNP